MKKLIILSVLILAFFVGNASAQWYIQTAKSEYGLASDTATNTENIVMGIEFSGSAYTQIKKDFLLSVSVTTAQLTGTIAGTVTLQGSMDGTTFVNLDSTSCGIDPYVGAAYTFTAADATTKLFYVRTIFPYYRVYYASSGTHTSTIAASYQFIRKDSH